MYKRIVLAVDLAEPTPAPKGLMEAVELAKTGGGELRLVNVQPVIPATFMEMCRSIRRRAGGAGQGGARTRFSAASTCPSSARALRRGQAGLYHELLEEASEWDADLIVVGSHRPVMSDYLLGSNAKTIVRHAQCSVLVVRE